ncbi:2Fe-2S iron-sulfur cluster-binding protein [Haliea sp. E17]|uniref:2Fe-2S iron-sulfur cluster-binding protein n=1 Tax=Haliea sp. E17 TaxID=3401576 RepID=UPI003AAD5C6B
MVTVKFIQPDGVEKVVEVPEGTSLMTAALENGVEGILGDCGGACSCATCHCYIDEAFLPQIPAAEDIEQSMIEFATDPKENSRLGCQVQVTEAVSGIVVRMPESQY